MAKRINATLKPETRQALGIRGSADVNRILDELAKSKIETELEELRSIVAATYLAETIAEDEDALRRAREAGKREVARRGVTIH